MPTKIRLVKAMVFLVVRYGCESWTIKKAEHWRTDAFESPLDYKEIQPVHPKGNQSWIFIGRTDAEAPILWPPDAKNWLVGKDPNTGKDWRQEKGTTEDEMVEWHHRLDGYEFEQALGVSDGQGSLACCSPWSCKESDTTEQLNWTEVGMDSKEVCVCVCVCVLVAQSCWLCDPMDCSLPGSSVHGILQARILEWVAITFSRGSSQSRDQTWVCCIAGRFFTVWVTKEVWK